MKTASEACSNRQVQAKVIFDVWQPDGVSYHAIASRACQAPLKVLAGPASTH